MINSPHVIIKSQYTPCLNHPNFKYTNSKKIIKETNNMFDYFADIKKKAYFMLDYFTGRICKKDETNLIIENGTYATQKQIEERKREYLKYIEHSNIYKLVISFPNGYLEKNVDIRKLEQAMAKDIIPKFLKKCDFEDIKNISYQFALHSNTDHLHFHLSFAEKKANYRKGPNKIDYRYNGKLTQEELAFLKNEIEHYIQKEKIYTPLLKETNNQIDLIKQYFNPNDKNYILNNLDFNLDNKIYRLGEMIEKERPNSKIVKFNSLKNNSIKKLTKEIKKNIYSDNLSEEYKNFLSTLSKINEYYDSLSKANNMEISFKDLTNSKVKYINNYVYNSIANYALNKYKGTKISETDLLQEIIYKNHKYNLEKLSNNEISHVFSKNKINCKKKKYINKISFNKYEIYKAVQNINYELEKAQDEFSKLFEKENEISK